MNPVRTLIQNATRTGTDVLLLSGTAQMTMVSRLANGVYFYRVEFNDENPVWGKILLLQ